LLALMQGFERHLNAIDPAEHAIRPDAALAGAAARMLGPEPVGCVLLAERGGAAVGYAAFAPVMWMDDRAPALMLSDLYVDAAARGAGVGRALMAALAGEARAVGARRVIWTVWRRNAPAFAFYRALGAEAVAGERLMSLALSD
jgi:GNAT superfamily N-acetyltransferase